MEIQEKLKNLVAGFVAFPRNIASIVQHGRKLGLKGLWQVCIADLFFGRTNFQWLYLLLLSSVPIVLEMTSGNAQHDWAGLVASWSGIVCVILVAEGRASNYLFGFLSNLIYFAISFQNMFYGEVMTAVFFIVMQPVGLYFWLLARVNGQEKADAEEASHFETRKLDAKGWLKWLAFTALVWLSFGFIYKSINSARPFRDSITDGTNWTGQFLQSYLYREQWFFWIATNLFSIYLWWGTSIHMQGMYWVYTLNSLVGWYQWSKAVKSAA